MSDRRETLSPSERRARNREIAEARRAGRPWRQIAARFGVSERQAARAAEEALRLSVEERGVAGLDPEVILGRIIRAQLRALDRLCVLMEDADNSNAEVGAARAAGSVGSDLRSSLVGAGLIPETPQRLRLQREARAAAVALVRAADGLDVPAERVEEELRRAPELMTAADLVVA